MLKITPFGPAHLNVGGTASSVMSALGKHHALLSVYLAGILNQIDVLLKVMAHDDILLCGEHNSMILADRARKETEIVVWGSPGHLPGDASFDRDLERTSHQVAKPYRGLWPDLLSKSKTLRPA